MKNLCGGAKVGKKKCVVCMKKRKFKDEPLCKNCLEFYKRKFEVSDKENVYDNLEFQELLKKD